MHCISYVGSYSKETFNFHKHHDHELYMYSSGKGQINIEGQFYDAEQGMIVVMPPNTVHGSISYDNLRYIAVLVKSDELMHIDAPIVFRDNERGEGASLLQMIFANRYESKEYLDSLCLAFIHFVLKNVKITDPIEKAVNEIKRQVLSRFHDTELNVTELLRQSGYAEDYIRAHFKKIVGKTPIEYLTELRVQHAKTLINIYQNAMLLSDVSFNCGFDDYIYFSRKFKRVVGVCPNAYKKSILTEAKN